MLRITENQDDILDAFYVRSIIIRGKCQEMLIREYKIEDDRLYARQMAEYGNN